MQSYTVPLHACFLPYSYIKVKRENSMYTRIILSFWTLYILYFYRLYIHFWSKINIPLADFISFFKC